MAYGGANNAPGPQGWAFLPTGPTQQINLAASTVTVTLAQFTSTLPYARQVAIFSQGANNANSVAFIAFGSTTVTVAATTGVPIVPAVLKSQHGGAGGPSFGGYEILTTGKSPTQYMAIGSAGTTTVWLTPGEGSH